MLVRIWKNWNSYILVVEMSNGAATVKNCPAVPQKRNIELPYDPASLILDIYTKELKTGTQTDTLQRCLQQHYSQQQEGGNSPSVWR